MEGEVLIMSHIFKKTEKKKRKKSKAYASVHQKVARLNSGNTITAKALLRKMDKEKQNGTENSKSN
jgi:hypothetical protein